jgi:prepilin-type N-terminal cleavage/methylation domain-containing protein
MLALDRSPRAVSGFSLIELVTVIVVLGIIAAFAIPKYVDFLQQSKMTTTQAELGNLKRAIVGNPQVAAGGRYTDAGYIGTVGYPPNSLSDLVHKPDSVSVYNSISRLGWNGPYIDSANGEYLKDAWGVNYVYDRNARTITSTGSGNNISVNF